MAGLENPSGNFSPEGIETHAITWVGGGVNCFHLQHFQQRISF